MMPSSLSSSFGSDKHEADNTETELGLLYNNYLQTLMANVLLKKKAIENENKILNQLGSISKEQDLGNEKLSKMKRRKKDVRYLTTLQNTLDSLITEIRSNIGKRQIIMLKSESIFKFNIIQVIFFFITEDLESQSVNEKLATLKTHLEPFDFLRCQGIDLPNTPEEKQKFEVTLKQCCKCLQEVSELLKEKSGNLQKVKSELKESIEAFKQIDGLQKNICTTMNNLQNLVLKTASQSLSETLS